MNWTEQLAQLRIAIQAIGVGMLTTMDAEGHLHSRPMKTLEIDDQPTLWFYTLATAGKAYETLEHPEVDVSYADRRDGRYLSFSGTARLVLERSHVERLWRPELESWFPSGPKDPELALLAVDVERVETWDEPTSRMVRLFERARSLVTGKPPRLKENEKLDLERERRS